MLFTRSQDIHWLQVAVDDALRVQVQQRRKNLIKASLEGIRGELHVQHISKLAVLQVQSNGFRGRPPQSQHPVQVHDVRVAELRQEVRLALQRVPAVLGPVVALQHVDGAVLLQT